MAINVFTEEGDKVIIQPPVYHPFRLTPQGNGRKVVYNPLRELPDGSYDMDFEQLEQVTDEHCKILILSNPHNPAGICWKENTLRRLAYFCYEHHILVLSDEIHSDMALFGNRHIPFATVSDEAAACSITFSAPSKTFNIAGIVSSYAIVPNPTLRRRFYSWLEANELNDPPLFSPIATIAAYSQGESWRRQMREHPLRGGILPAASSEDKTLATRSLFPGMARLPPTGIAARRTDRFVCQPRPPCTERRSNVRSWRRGLYAP